MKGVYAGAGLFLGLVFGVLVAVAAFTLGRPDPSASALPGPLPEPARPAYPAALIAYDASRDCWYVLGRGEEQLVPLRDLSDRWKQRQPGAHVTVFPGERGHGGKPYAIRTDGLGRSDRFDLIDQGRRWIRSTGPDTGSLGDLVPGAK